MQARMSFHPRWAESCLSPTSTWQDRMSRLGHSNESVLHQELRRIGRRLLGLSKRLKDQYRLNPNWTGFCARTRLRVSSYKRMTSSATSDRLAHLIKYSCGHICSTRWWQTVLHGLHIHSRLDLELLWEWSKQVRGRRQAKNQAEQL